MEGTREKSKKRWSNLKQGFPLGRKPGIVETVIPPDYKTFHPTPLPKSRSSFFGSKTPEAEQATKWTAPKGKKPHFRDTR